MLKPRDLGHHEGDETDATFGKIRILLRTTWHELFDGTWVKDPFPWVVLERGNAVAILIHDNVMDEIVLVEQFRPAMKESVLEIPAGMIEEGELPEDCVRREVMEEVGLVVEDITLISTIYTSPGITSEKIFIYQATVNALGDDGLVAGLKSEGENVLKHVVSVNEALEMVDKGVIKDAKTIIAIQNVYDEKI